MREKGKVAYKINSRRLNVRTSFTQHRREAHSQQKKLVLSKLRIDKNIALETYM